MRLIPIVLFTSCLVCLPDAARAGDVGSADFKPTPDHPIGWRGDFTGRFPGATPPTAWSRRVKGLTSQLKYQSDKPSGAGAADARALEYFTIKDWLVAGPFPIKDPVADIDDDLLNGEDTVEPARDAKSTDPTWTPIHTGIDTQSTHYHNEGTCGDLNVDFVYTFGHLPASGLSKTPPPGLDNKVAYAHTYIYSPAAGDVMLRVNFKAAAIKAFFNGRPVVIKRDQPVKVTMEKGWNRLLVKAASDIAAAHEGQNAWDSHWRFAAYLEPVLPVSYETNNIAWMTKLTGRSMSQPIVVADRIYVGSGMTDLICIDRKTGRILWLKSNTPADGLTDEERADIPAIKEKIDPLIAKLNAANDEAVKAINASVSPTGLSSEQQAALDKILKNKSEAERAVHLAFRSVDRKKFPPMYENEVSASNSTPITDGKFVYWSCGGGMKGPGAQVIACFDLDGKRIWTRFDTSFGSSEHGNHISPNLVDGKLIYSATGTLVAFDAQTGKDVWRNHPDDWQNLGNNPSPIVVKIGDTSAIIAGRYVHRASDGTVICPSNLDVWGVLTPVVENGIAFNPSHWRGWNDPVSFIGVRLPTSVTPGSKTQIAVDLDGKDATMPVRIDGPTFMVASPLYVNGVVYSLEIGGGLCAVDTVAKKALYRKYLDGYNRYNRFLYGAVASPTLAGKNIYITDDAGCTHILQPGPDAKILGRNLIENIDMGGSGGNPCKQESFYTSPVFEGKAMYLRGEEYLYCISEN